MDTLVEYRFVERDGEFWIDVTADRVRKAPIGPFGSRDEGQRAYDDLLIMMRASGAVDTPATGH